MGGELRLERKYHFRAAGQNLYLKKRINESEKHVLLKSLTYALYSRLYTGISIDIPIGDRYKPDLVKLDGEGKPVFWAECGKLSRKKIRKICKKYKGTHFVFVGTSRRFGDLVSRVAEDIAKIRRGGPVELIKLPDDLEKYFDDRRNITIQFSDCHIVKL